MCLNNNYCYFTNNLRLNNSSDSLRCKEDLITNNKNIINKVENIGVRKKMKN